MQRRQWIIGAATVVSVAFGWGAASAQNLDAGKTAPQLYAGSCVICHKSAPELARQVAGRSIESFLRVHYTTSREEAAVMAAYLRAIPEGAEPTRRRGGSSSAKLGEPGEAREPARAQRRRARPAAPEHAPGDATSVSPVVEPSTASQPPVSEPTASEPTASEPKPAAAPAPATAASHAAPEPSAEPRPQAAEPAPAPAASTPHESAKQQPSPSPSSDGE